MKKLILGILFFAALSAEAQTPISALPTYTADPTGGWIPVVVGTTTRKTDAKNLGNLDSLAVASGSTYDTLKVFKNGVQKYYKLIRAGGGFDTTAIYTAIGLKLNITDTSSMLSPYLRSNVAAATYVPYTGATSDVDLGTRKLSAQSATITGTGGNGHIHMRFQSSTPTGQGNHTTFYADATGLPYYKIDGNTPVKFQPAINLTTTGASGAATFDGVNLNIPQYSGGGGVSDSLQTITTDTVVTITNGVNIVYVNPSVARDTIAITLPSSPSTSKEIDFYFGGTITSGTVATLFTIAGNTGQTILQSTTPSLVEAGDHIGYKWNSSLSKWFRK